eukprot:COSAG02_NODE_5957_length_3913_cov_50.745674_3_plen_96_part_00
MSSHVLHVFAATILSPGCCFVSRVVAMLVRMSYPQCMGEQSIGRGRQLVELVEEIDRVLGTLDPSRYSSAFCTERATRTKRNLQPNIQYGIQMID